GARSGRSVSSARRIASHSSQSPKEAARAGVKRMSGSFHRGELRREQARTNSAKRVRRRERGAGSVDRGAPVGGGALGRASRPWSRRLLARFSTKVPPALSAPRGGSRPVPERQRGAPPRNAASGPLGEAYRTLRGPVPGAVWTKFSCSIQ